MLLNLEYMGEELCDFRGIKIPETNIMLCFLPVNQNGLEC